MPAFAHRRIVAKGEIGACHCIANFTILTVGVCETRSLRNALSRSGTDKSVIAVNSGLALLDATGSAAAPERGKEKN